MLAGNLPFGKDLLQCPRFEEFCSWQRSKNGQNGHNPDDFQNDHRELEDILEEWENPRNNLYSSSPSCSSVYLETPTPNSPSRSGGNTGREGLRSSMTSMYPTDPINTPENSSAAVLP